MESNTSQAPATVDHPPGNPFAVSIQQPAGMMQVASSRHAQEVQASMVIAQKFPRDEQSAYTRIMTACKRKTLAEAAVYSYPRGDTTVTGPSIRLAEVMAQSWGNIDFGIVELEQKDGESTMMAYAWDLQTNTRQTKIFTVKHERHKRGGSVTQLTDPRDIYEMTANQGARRLRACILGVIPGDIIDEAVTQCERTMASGNTEPLIDRVKKMLVAFADLGVTQQMIERRLKHRIDTCSEHELVGLRRIYTALKDNMGNRDSYFDPSEAVEAQVASPEKSSKPEKSESILKNSAQPQPQQEAVKEASKAQDKAQEPKTTAPVSTPAQAEEPIHVRFGALLDENKFTFDQFARWAAETGNIPDATSYGSLQDVPAKTLERIYQAKVGLINQLKRYTGQP